MIRDEEPPLSTETRKIKISKGNRVLDKITNLGLQLKSKNHLNKVNQFLAYCTKLIASDALSKTAPRAVSSLKSAKNFIIDRRLTPHFAVVLLGLIVALCNVIVVRGADNLYNLIPANPSSQIAIASSIGRYTPLIPNTSLAVENMVTTSSADPNAGVFAVDTKTIATTVTTREEPVAVAPASPAGPREKNISYTVQGGDTLSGLAMRYNVKVSSLQFANDLTNADMIKPGQSLKIPPDGWEPSAAQVAAKKKTQPQVASSSKTKFTSVSYKAGSKANAYPYGYCTYYVATRRAVPSSWGNAGLWLGNAQRAGYATGRTPAVGAIMVTRESWWGHVAFVESVNGNSFTVAEMNYAGWGVTSRRTVSVNDSVIKGFVY